MVFNQREKTIASAAVAAAVGAGALYMLFNRKQLIRKFTDPLYGQSIQVITNAEECQKIIGMLRLHCQEFRVLGFDCEWVTEQGKRHPVALLQLASHRGLCALIRLCEMKRIPAELGELLNDPAILKVGVGPVEDAKLLKSDFNLKVESSLDLRYLAEKCGLPGPYGMARLADGTLGVKLDKHWRVRASNWENPELTERQLKYAANDAHVAVELFRKFAQQLVPRAIWTSRKKWFKTTFDEFECFLDQRYTDKPKNYNPNRKSKKKFLEASNGSNVNIKRSMATRAKPLYDNCLMQAPDGEILCTCDRRKAEWYVIKGLAEIVSDQPTYTVRLMFEPKGRAVGDVGKYYQMMKENKCVVCGAKDSYIRKNVVPRDYRRHFPLVMKEHSSHDVLLLCAPCHRGSNMSDENMRLKLSSICTAPYTNIDNPKEIRVQHMAELRKAARALVYCADKIPDERKQGLVKKMQKMLPKGTEVTPQLLDHFANVNVTTPNAEYYAHGEKVVDHFKQLPGGLSELEKMWRQHFLRTMKPKYMPELWCVEHNFKRLEIRADEGRVEQEDLQAAGVTRPIAKGSSSDNSSSSNFTSNSLSNGNTDSLGSYSSSGVQISGRESDNDSTTRDVSSYRDEEVAGITSEPLSRSDFFSNCNESETLYDSATPGGSGSATLEKEATDQFKTVVPPTTAEKDESEMATVNDFASIESSYDTDDSDSTLSQPSMTLLNSTDDWEAEANEPSVNGSVALAH